MIAITVNKEDTVKQAAEKIFRHFEVAQSCTIIGIEEMPDGTLEAKGMLVLREIERLDKAENFTSNGSTRGNGLRRRRVKPDNTIGDYLRNKIWQWTTNVIDNKIRFTIWRIQ